MSSDVEFPAGSQRVNMFAVSPHFKGLKSRQVFFASESHKLNLYSKKKSYRFKLQSGAPTETFLGGKQRNVLSYCRGCNRHGGFRNPVISIHWVWDTSVTIKKSKKEN